MKALMDKIVKWLDILLEQKKLVRRSLVVCSFVIWFIVTYKLFIAYIEGHLKIDNNLTTLYATLTSFLGTLTSFYTATRSKEVREVAKAEKDSKKAQDNKKKETHEDDV